MNRLEWSRYETWTPYPDYIGARPFEIVQIDLKYIRDHKALSGEQMIHLETNAIYPTISGVLWMLIHDSSSLAIQERKAGLMGYAGIYGSSPG